jgi:hypothetical protein
MKVLYHDYFSTFALDYTIRKIQENKERLELNRTHQFFDYADVHLLGTNINIIKKHIETLLNSNKEVGLEISI